MNNGPIAGLLAGCFIYLASWVVAHVVRQMLRGRQDRLNWETVMTNMRKELRYSQGLRKRNLNYLKYYRGTA